MLTLREISIRLCDWKLPRLPLNGRHSALFWWIALVSMNVMAWRYYRHPLYQSWRSFEFPAMLAVAFLGIWSVWNARKLSVSPERRLESGLRLALGALLAILVVGQEGVFRWQQSQVLRGGAALSRIGQHFVVGFRDFDELKPLAERGLIGGIYITRRNLENETVASLKERIGALQRLRTQAGLKPLFVMADQEGGKVSHLSPLLPRLPPLSSLLDGGAENLDARAYAYGEQQGRSLADIGINMNLAPVVDLKIESTEQWDDRWSLIEQRAIADDPWIVARVASAYGKGLLANGVQPTVKHFPGLGRVKADTHFAKATLASDPVEQAADWLPFREVTAHTGAAMMLSHVRLPAIDPDKPASLSRAVVQDVLRKEEGLGWNYQGLLITDDLNMGAVYDEGIGRAAVAALDAEVDLILVSFDPDQYYPALYAAWKAWKRGSVNAVREARSTERISGHWKLGRMRYRLAALAMPCPNGETCHEK